MALDSVTLQSMGLSDLVGNNQGGESIEVPDDPMASENAVVTPLPDGGEEIDLNPEDAQADIDHDDNLAEYMEEADLNALASDITGYVKEDRDSRADWEGMLTTAMEYLGLKGWLVTGTPGDDLFLRSNLTPPDRGDHGPLGEIVYISASR